MRLTSNPLLTGTKLTPQVLRTQYFYALHCVTNVRKLQQFAIPVQAGVRLVIRTREFTARVPQSGLRTACLGHASRLSSRWDQRLDRPDVEVSRKRPSRSARGQIPRAKRAEVGTILGTTEIGEERRFLAQGPSSPGKVRAGQAVCTGAGRGSRTPKGRSPADFESAASASSAIPAC